MVSPRMLLCQVRSRLRAYVLPFSRIQSLTASSPSSPAPLSHSGEVPRNGAPNFPSQSFLSIRDTSRNTSQLSAPNGSDKLLVIDTFALVRKLEARGFNVKQAEAITSAMTDVINDCLQNVSDSFVSKSELEQYNMMLEAACRKLQTDVQSAQEKRLLVIQRETEKLRVDIGKLQNHIRFDMDKVAAGQQLDLNLERGRIKEELASQSAETSSLTNKLDKEINTLKTQLEASKYEVIKYCIGTIVSVYALGLALLRIFK